jgi:hypothetical protein
VFQLIFDCWDDEDSVKILRQCKRAIPARDAGGKVIIVNCVLGYGAQDSVAMETQVWWAMVGLSEKSTSGKRSSWKLDSAITRLHRYLVFNRSLRFSHDEALHH